MNGPKTLGNVCCLPETEKAKSQRLELGDPIIPGNEPYCGSSTDLSMLGNEQFDLVITDPPFGNNLLLCRSGRFLLCLAADFLLRKWYAGLPEAAYFEPERTPHSLEAMDNSAEHPDDREDYEKDLFIEPKHLTRIRELTGDESLLRKTRIRSTVLSHPATFTARRCPLSGPRQAVVSRMAESWPLPSTTTKTVPGSMY